MREWLERQARAAGAAPAGARAARRCCARRGAPARFVWDRVTPGDLGLELTTLLAVAGVGAFVFVWDLVRIEQDNGLLAGDAASLRLADRLHMDALVSVAKVVTELGSLPVAIALVVLGGRDAGWRRHGSARRWRSSSASRSPTRPCTSPRTPSTARGRRARSSTSTARPIPRATPRTR